MVILSEEKIRIQKIDNLRKLGINPFLSDVHRTHTVVEFIKVFSKLKKDAVLCGRVVGLRPQGGLTFAHLKDGTGKVQIILRKDLVSDTSYKLWQDFIDRGDFIEITGRPFTTNKGEKSLIASSWRLLTKTIRPLPEKWHGLKDTEERFRKRYLDLIMNEEVAKRFIVRSKIISEIRNFLDAHGYIEIETPALQTIYGGGFARPFRTHHNALDIDLYLRISDEMYLKRLIVGGFEKVYEITKVFRNEGIDHDHNPEFTMLEAQTAFENYKNGMELIENIFEYIALKVHGTTELIFDGQKISLKRPWRRMTMVESIKSVTGVDVNKWKNLKHAKKDASVLMTQKKAKDTLANMASIGEVIALIFEEVVEETLLQPTIIYDYPVEVSPLAKRCADDSRFAERFEYFVFGSELGNNYTELSDPIDLKSRFVEEKKRKEAGFEEAHQYDEDYLEAIAHGFPPTSGISIGIDRMVMLFTDTKAIKEVILFPTLRPKK